MLRCIDIKESTLGHLITDASNILETTSTESFAVRFALEVLESESFEEESEEISSGVKHVLQILKTYNCPTQQAMEVNEKLYSKTNPKENYDHVDVDVEIDGVVQTIQMLNNEQTCPIEKVPLEVGQNIAQTAPLALPKVIVQNIEKLPVLKPTLINLQKSIPTAVTTIKPAVEQETEGNDVSFLLKNYSTKIINFFPLHYRTCLMT